MSYAVVLPNIPRSFSAGESVSWEREYSRFPAGEWMLTYVLVSGDNQIVVTASEAGTKHLVEVPSATSQAYAAGQYHWQSHVTKDAERYLVESGVVEVKSDFASQESGIDARSHTKKVLDALEAAIEGRASKTQVEQNVGGVQIQHIPLTDQVMLRDQYAMKYRKEQAAINGRSSRRTIGPRFCNR